MSKELIIKLDTNFSMFTMAVHPGFQYLGRVQRGMEVGALAITPDGDYVQVNGSVVTPLNSSRVQSALRKLQGRFGPIAALRTPRVTIAELLPAMPPAPEAVPPPPPVIVIKKKRIAVMP